MRHADRSLARSWALGLVASLAIASAHAGEAPQFPTRPVRLVVGFTPGGGVDINARLLGAKLAELWNQPVIVDNRPGAGTNIANEFVARAAPDGHTLLVNTAAVAINMSLYRNLGYDTLRDLAAVSVFSESPNILVVRAALPARDVAELVAMAKARPGALNFSSAGAGSTQHLSGELFRLRAGIEMTHVPYKGSAPSIAALIAGEVDMTFANIPAIHQHMRSGRLRALATTGARRAETLPEVRTLEESGVSGVAVSVWYGVLAPSATPRPLIDSIADAVGRAARSPDVRARLVEQGAEPVGSTPSGFDRLLREEVTRWQEVIRGAGLRVD